MSKINILFNDKNYNIDESSFSSAFDTLKSHLSTVMNGSGVVINLDGVSYNVDSTKFTNARNDFVSHLVTIAGSGYKVIVNGVEYSFDINKIKQSISDLEVVLGNLHNPDEVIDIVLVLDEGTLDYSVLE